MMPDSPSVPPSVQAWDMAEQFDIPEFVREAGAALRAENEVLRASREMWRTKRTDEISLDLAAARAENLRLREALQLYADPKNWRADDWGVTAVFSRDDGGEGYGDPTAPARAALRVPADPPTTNPDSVSSKLGVGETEHVVPQGMSQATITNYGLPTDIGET